ncbi:MAG: type VI secretion system-associated protein TagF [Marinibacterium sp.]
MPAVVLNSGMARAVPFRRCGAFGKIAAAGDFIRFDLASDFVAAWDDWLQSALIAARGHFGSRWADLYMSAPIWRFTCPPGVAGSGAFLGVLMPSTDRVGRMFPLTLAGQISPDRDLAEIHFRAHNLFEALEATALTTLDDLPLADLKESCATIAADDPSWDPAPAVAAHHLPLNPGQCLWSTRLSDGFRLMRSDGLPGAAAFAAMFDVDAVFWQETARQWGAS